MKIWPSESFEIQTAMPAENVVALLQSRIKSTKLFGLPKEEIEFQGEVSQDKFKIKRILCRKPNSQLFVGFGRPDFVGTSVLVITGKIQATDIGTTIRITMRLHRVPAFSLCCWLFLGADYFISLLGDFFTGEAFTFDNLSATIVFLAGWAMFMGMFWMETRHLKKILLEELFSTEKSDA